MRKMMLSGMLLGLAAATTMSASAAADPPQRCYGIAGGGSTRFDPDNFNFSGTVDIRVGGKLQQVDVVAWPKLDGSGTTHTFAFDQGVIATDDVFLAPVALQFGPQQLWSALTVNGGGTGAMRLLPTGTIDFEPGIASWDVRGHVCFDES